MSQPPTTAHAQSHTVTTPSRCMSTQQTASDSLPCHHLTAQITASSWSHLDQLRCVRRMYNTLLCSTRVHQRLPPTTLPHNHTRPTPCCTPVAYQQTHTSGHNRRLKEDASADSDSVTHARNGSQKHRSCGDGAQWFHFRSQRQNTPGRMHFHTGRAREQPDHVLMDGRAGK
jgi:hypothetical protein